MRYWILFAIVVLVGCGDKSYSAKSEEISAAPSSWAGDDLDYTLDNLPMENSIESSFEGRDGEAGFNTRNRSADSSKTSQQSDAIKASEKKRNVKRKIVYSARMDVVVEQFDGIEQQIGDLVDKFEGFISSANIGRYQGTNRKGSWKIRIPVVNYQAFLNSIGNIGVPAARNETAADVTAEFYDLEARIANKKKLEERIIELLERPEDKLQHVIEVERELARVREEIEQMEGRKRYLSDITSLTTISINVLEQQNYTPPQAPTLTNRVKRAWNNSLVQCQEIFENTLVLVVRNAIGFGIFLLALLIAWPWLRKLYRTVYKSNSTVPAQRDN